MKRIFAFLMILALLIPMGMVANAAETGTEIKPFYLVNWSKAEGEEFSNVYPMIYLWANNQNPERITCPLLGGDTPEVIAENLKEEFDKYPEGARYINFSPMGNAFKKYGEVCFFDNAVPSMQRWLETFLSYYKQIGGKLDGITIDMEILDGYASYLEGRFASKDPLVYDWIVNHPTYQEKIRPQLVERGFKFYDNVTQHTPEIYGLHSSSGSAYDQSRSIWNAIMRKYVGELLNEICAPLWKYYPDALMSDYCTKDSKSWNKDQELGYNGGHWVTAGNMSNENFYNIRPGNHFYTDSVKKTPAYSTIPGYAGALYEVSAFHRFQFDSNVAKTTALSADNGKVSWWVVGHQYGTKGEGTICETPYYVEDLIHLGMQNPEVFIGYILQQDSPNGDFDQWALSLHIVDDVLKELTRVVGGADRERIEAAPSWNEHYVLSGMHVGGKNVWRLSPNGDKVSLENFKVEGSDPTFEVDGQTITFPGGKIIETGKVREVGTYGYWIETPENVYPVTTRTEDYFRMYPAYAETFEAYENGMVYNYNNALPMGCWEIVKQSNGSGTVVAHGNGKALEMKGTYTAKNVNMPENVIAGDTYAENQAWEVTVKLPSDMSADAELVLLNYTDSKNKAKDGGFKVAGGKVYYSQEKEYVELPNVTLTNGSTYTFVREVNFSDAENFESNYTVYDAEGKLVGQIKNIPVAKFTLPVVGISFGCKNVNGEAVVVDNYKLYQTRVAADFYLYDAATGMLVTEMDQARDKDTAFRLSYLNATNKEKSYTVMAAYYNGETLVEEKVVSEVKMAPNDDGVITGIVKNETAGQTLKVYLKDNNPAEEEEENPVVGDTPEDPVKSDNNMLIIIIAAAAVVLVVVVVVIIAASAKKKKKAAPASEALEAEEAPETTEE